MQLQTDDLFAALEAVGIHVNEAQREQFSKTIMGIVMSAGIGIVEECVVALEEEYLSALPHNVGYMQSATFLRTNILNELKLIHAKLLKEKLI